MLGLRVKKLGSQVCSQGLDTVMWGFGLRVEDLGFRVKG